MTRMSHRSSTFNIFVAMVWGWSQATLAQELSQAPSPSVPANDHVPPPPPETLLSPHDGQHDMSDNATRAMWRFDQLEYRHASDGTSSATWSGAGWWGTDLDRVWLRTEGERSNGSQQQDAELLWGHAIGRLWDMQLGARQDFGDGPDRQWLAIGVQGIAPYWFDVALTLYVGPHGRTALRLESSYDLLLTQRLILQPRVELSAYGQSDTARSIPSGIYETQASLRLRYEFSRQFAPYFGVSWEKQQRGEISIGRQVLVGVRMWF